MVDPLISLPARHPKRKGEPGNAHVSYPRSAGGSRPRGVLQRSGLAHRSGRHPAFLLLCGPVRQLRRREPQQQSQQPPCHGAVAGTCSNETAPALDSDPCPGREPWRACGFPGIRMEGKVVRLFSPVPVISYETTGATWLPDDAAANRHSPLLLRPAVPPAHREPGRSKRGRTPALLSEPRSRLAPA